MDDDETIEVAFTWKADDDDDSGATIYATGGSGGGSPTDPLSWDGSGSSLSPNQAAAMGMSPYDRLRYQGGFDVGDRLTLISPDGDRYDVDHFLWNETVDELAVKPNKLPDPIDGLSADDFVGWEVVVTVNGGTFGGWITNGDEDSSGTVYQFRL